MITAILDVNCWPGVMNIVHGCTYKQKLDHLAIGLFRTTLRNKLFITWSYESILLSETFKAEKYLLQNITILVSAELAWPLTLLDSKSQWLSIVAQPSNGRCTQFSSGSLTRDIMAVASSSANQLPHHSQSVSCTGLTVVASLVHKHAPDAIWPRDSNHWMGEMGGMGWGRGRVMRRTGSKLGGRKRIEGKGRVRGGGRIDGKVVRGRRWEEVRLAWPAAHEGKSMDI